MAVEALKKVQFAKETSHGTPATADTMLGFMCTIPEDDREVHVPRVEMGVRMTEYLDAAIVKRLVADGIGLEDSDGVYFEALPALFSTIIVGNVTPTDASPLYTWEFAVNQSGTENLDTITLEAGDDAGGYRIPYCIGKSFQMSADVDGGDANMSAELVGQYVELVSMTAGLSLPTMTLLQGKRSRLYIDDTWAGLGTTEVTNTLVGWEVNFEGGGHQKHWGSANMEFDGHQQGEIRGTCVLTMERNASTRAEELLYRPASGGTAITKRFVRLTNTGPTLGGGNHELTLDMAGVWRTWGSIASANNGNTYDVATLSFGYDGTGAQGFRAEVATSVASI